MIKKIDHSVITVKDALATVLFYEKLGFIAKQNVERYELYAGDFKINVHILGKELSPHAHYIQPGSADLCFEIAGAISGFKEWLVQKAIPIELGIVDRNGTRGAMKSIYLRDPDGNLLEFCSYE